VIKNTGTNWKTGDQGASGTLVAAFDPALNGELRCFSLISKLSTGRTTSCFVFLMNVRSEWCLHGGLSIC
jgi:hypothetical protein